MRTAHRRTLLVLILGLISSQGWALGLEEALDAALQNDPTYRSAQHERDAGAQNVALGRSKLLPNLSLDYQKGTNLLGISNVGSPQPGQQVNYISEVTTLSLRQPLFNLGDMAMYRQGKAQANYSDAQFSGHAQDLILRLVQAYTDVLYAQDQLDLVQAQHTAYGEQMKANERLFQKGQGTLTDTLETQSKYALSESQVIEAQENLATVKRSFNAIVGTDIVDLEPLTDEFHPAPLDPSDFDEWKSLALDHNPDITAQRYAVDASEQEVKKDQAGHSPQLDLVGSVSRNNQGTIYTFAQDMFVRSIGIELSIPLYAGGYVTALSSQAKANMERAQADLDDKINKVLVDLYKQYGLVLSSFARIRALEQAVNSAQQLIKATRMSIQGGERVNLDLLNAQSQYYQARRDLAKARYDYLNSYLHLNADAGTLTKDDIKRLAQYFDHGSVKTAQDAIPHFDAAH